MQVYLFSGIFFPYLRPLDFTAYCFGKFRNIVNDSRIFVWSSIFFDMLLQFSGQAFSGLVTWMLIKSQAVLILFFKGESLLKRGVNINKKGQV
jgi:hypothetical protein